VDIEALLQLDGHNVHDRSVGTVSISAPGAADLSKVRALTFYSHYFQ